jgi:hypothetical protein
MLPIAIVVGRKLDGTVVSLRSRGEAVLPFFGQRQTEKCIGRIWIEVQVSPEVKGRPVEIVFLKINLSEALENIGRRWTKL